jgi:hypothetical protein
LEVSMPYAKRTVLIVMDANQGVWRIIVDPIGKDDVGVFRRKREATLRGRAWLQAHGGGELVIQNPSGRIVERDQIRAT